MTARRVIVLCGPPGAGKTTVARSGDLAVFDRDDPGWQGERHFRTALFELGSDPYALAIVIRSGATSSARAKATALVQATHLYLLTAPEDELRRRIEYRGRADARRGLASLQTWHRGWDHADRVQHWPGWDRLPDRNWQPDPQRITPQRLSTRERGLDEAHRSDRVRLLRVLVDGAPCPLTEKCGGLPMFHPARCPFPGDGRTDGLCFACRLDRDHSIPRALGGTRSEGRLAHARCNRQVGADMTNSHRVDMPTW